MLIHGAWLPSRSWDSSAEYFGKRGFAVSAPEWPRKRGDVEQLRQDAEQLKGLGIAEAASIDSWLEGVLEAEPAQAEVARRS
jgi:hypothetical protein